MYTTKEGTEILEMGNWELNGNVEEILKNHQQIAITINKTTKWPHWKEWNIQSEIGNEDDGHWIGVDWMDIPPFDKNRNAIVNVLNGFDAMNYLQRNGEKSMWKTMRHNDYLFFSSFLLYFCSLWMWSVSFCKSDRYPVNTTYVQSVHHSNPLSNRSHVPCEEWSLECEMLSYDTADSCSE